MSASSSLLCLPPQLPYLPILSTSFTHPRFFSHKSFPNHFPDCPLTTFPSLPLQTGPFLRDIPGTGWLNPVSHVLFAPLWGAAFWVSFWKGLTVRRPADFDDYAKAMNAFMRSEGHLAALGAMMRGPKKPCWDVTGDVKCPVLLIFGESGLTMIA